VRGLALALAALTVAGAFGVVGLTLALVGAGVSFLAATTGAALLAGGAAYFALDALVVRPLSPLGSGTPVAIRNEIAEQRARLAALEATMPSLRHDVRGLLSPAVLVSDRLTAHPDPEVVRVGETVMGVVTRVIDRLATTRDPASRPGSAKEHDSGGLAAPHQHDGTLVEKSAEPLGPAPRT
jgi:hypothetical protein